MLKNGHKVFAGKIVELLTENSVYQSYLVDCGDAKFAKMVWVCLDPLFAQEQQRAFFDKVNWLAGQSFPYIGAPIKTAEVEGQPACLYPLPSGVALAQLLTRPFSARQAVELIKQIASCLALPHSAGCWHGNLSPDTIYIDGDIPYLADFSLSQLVRLDYHSGIDPRYTSPEQVRGENTTAAADIYNLGCIFYQLLTGQPPFVGDEPFAIAKQHLEGGFPQLPQGLELLQPLIGSLTAANIDKRYSIDQFITALTLLATESEIDKIVPLTEIEESSIDNPEGGETVSLLDETMDSSELAARIEARLKDHVAELEEIAEPETPLEDVNAVAEQLDQIETGKGSGFGRFVLALLLGIAIGSGLYYFLYGRSPAVNMAMVEADITSARTLVADLDQGLSLWQNEDFNGAEVKFKELITEYNKDPRAYNNLAAFYAAQGNYEQARDYLEQALATDVNYATVYQNLGSVYAEMARGAYGRALQLGKTKGLIALPVFSSYGVVQVNQIDAVVAVVPEEGKAGANTELAVAGKQIAAATTEKVATKVDDIPTINLAEQPVAVVTEPVPQEVPEVTSPVVTVAKLEEKNNVAVNDVTVPAADGAERFLHDWAQAWSSQDVDAYLACYADAFIPPAGKSRQQWEVQRRSRLANPKKINIQINKLQFEQLDNGHLQVDLIQSYKSDVYSDQTRKVFILGAAETGWGIYRERSLGMIR